VGSARSRAVVLDAGALVAFELNDKAIRRLVELALQHGGRLHVPAGVLAQVWRDGARQARLARLVKSGLLAIQDLDVDEARATGTLCGAAGTSDVVDASVAILARRHDAAVVTSDPADLRHLDAALTLIAC